MSLKLFTLLILIAGHSFSQETANSARVDTFTVATWNIWRGCNDQELFEDGRPHCIDILKELNPDIILMVETYGFGPQLANALDLNFHLIAAPGTPLNNSGTNLSIFSRWPFGKHTDFYGYFNVGGIEVSLSEHQKVKLFNTWFNYNPWEDQPHQLGLNSVELIDWEKSGSRPAEVTAILDGMQPYLDNSDSVPVIMGGDHNIWSHLDWTEENKDIHNGLSVNWWTSSTIAARGFIDSYREINPDPTTHPGITWDLPNIADEHRIDYIYYKGEKINPAASDIYKEHYNDSITLNGNRYLYPSDHGIVVTKFMWEPQSTSNQPKNGETKPENIRARFRKNHLQIESELLFNSSGILELLNLKGESLLRHSHSGGGKKLTLPVHNLRTGLYMVTLTLFDSSAPQSVLVLFPLSN